MSHNAEKIRSEMIKGECVGVLVCWCSDDDDDVVDVVVVDLVLIWC